MDHKVECISETELLRLQNADLKVRLAKKDLEEAQVKKREVELGIIRVYELSDGESVNEDGRIARVGQ